MSVIHWFSLVPPVTWWNLHNRTHRRCLTGMPYPSVDRTINLSRVAPRKKGIFRALLFSLGFVTHSARRTFISNPCIGVWHLYSLSLSVRIGACLSFSSHFSFPETTWIEKRKERERENTSLERSDLNSSPRGDK